MLIGKWLKNNTSPLCGKTVAVTGTTGGLGRCLCRYLASLGASLVLVDRDPVRSGALRDELSERFTGISVQCVTADLEDIEAVRTACERLKTLRPDVLIHNAGAYSIPRRKCAAGLDNVFMINFAAPYYMTKELLPILEENGGRVVAVGSIAHNYSVSDPSDVDFSGHRRASRVYGNTKRYLMFSLYELFKDRSGATLAVVHPGISLTNITAHYPKVVFAVIKYPMKLIFMSPAKACLSTLRGVFESCGYKEWIGPRLFDVWGKPVKKRLRTCGDAESAAIFRSAEEIYERLSAEARRRQGSGREEKN